jgi:hypothetical protein
LLQDRSEMVLQAQRTSATADSGHLLAEEPGDEDQILALSYRIRLHYCKQGGGNKCLPADLGLVLAETGDEAKIVGFTRDRIGQLRRCKGRIATGDVIAGVGGDCCGTRESVIRAIANQDSSVEDRTGSIAAETMDLDIRRSFGSTSS